MLVQEERVAGGVVVHAGHGRTWFGPAGGMSDQAAEAIRRVARCGLSLAEADAAIEVSNPNALAHE